MAKQLVNVAKGKKLTDTKDFCKIFGGLNVFQKTEVIKKLQHSLDNKITVEGKPIPDKDMPALKQLTAWAGMNLMVGNDLCPSDNLSKF